MNAAFLVRRFTQAVVVVIGVTLIVFLMLHLLPGGPARAILGPQATPLQIHEFNVQNGYNEPLYVQYAHYISQLAQGNLGFSYTNNKAVTSLIGSALPKTAVLVGLAYALGLLVGVPMGIWQASRRGRISDHILTTVAFTGYSMPIFWLGLLMILLFSVNLHLLPPEGPQGATVAADFADPSALILPVVALTITVFAGFARFARSAAVDNLSQEFIRTARSKGLSGRRVLVHHVLRNSLLPLISLIGLTFPLVISGAVVVEQVFNYPGMGLLFWNAAVSHDYPVVMGVVLVVSVATVLGSMVADILYALADPRVRY